MKKLIALGCFMSLLGACAATPEPGDGCATSAKPFSNVVQKPFSNVVAKPFRNSVLKGSTRSFWTSGGVRPDTVARSPRLWYT